MEKDQLNLSAIRARLASKKGRPYWRSLEELAETEEFQEFLYREFPKGASEWTDPISRRNFLKIMGASLGLAGLTACSSQPPERILPYIQAPEEIIPGQPLFFATAMPFNGDAIGLLAENHMGRPTKIEGNPDHPASLGATDVFAQASILSLYDPDRAKVVTYLGTRISTWNAFVEALNSELDAQRPTQGAGLRILTETITSPTLASQLEAVLTQFPSARWYQYEPAGRDSARLGARLAFGEDVETHYRFDQADVVLSLDANFLASGPGHVRYARDFADKRRVRADQTTMNRLYVVESTPTPTGSAADHRLPLRASQVESFARALAQELGLAVEATDPSLADRADWIAALARDLQSNRGASVVIAGNQQPPLVHALAHAINETLGNVGNTIIYTDPIEAAPVDQNEELRQLVEEMSAGDVQLLLIIGGNPVFYAPADLQFAEHIFNVPTRIHWSLYEDETSELCQWHIPATHYLESWSDARAYDGAVSIVQPLIAPLYDGQSAHELIAALLGQTGASDYDIVRAYWEEQTSAEAFTEFWQTVLHTGLIADTALPTRPVSLQADFDIPQAAEAGANQGLELIFQPDPTIWDGRFANNGWLQELPKPLTKLTWDNAALISPATAERLGLTNEELVELHYRERAVRAPIWIVPGHANDAVTVYLGYGRTRAGNVGTGIGFNAYALRTSDAPWFGSGLEIVKTGERYELAVTQDHHSLIPPEERTELIVRSGTLAQFQAEPNFVPEMEHVEEPLSLYPEYEYDDYAWGMAIDLTSCNGCNACVVACQAENNIPVVGKTEVQRGREMHWLRIDQYYRGNLDNPETFHQPMLCQHCEKAPCEVVCPVAATVHDSEGLNVMVYNRCVGTRYCSNNCPYKVRRFNFFEYVDSNIISLKLMRNPDVTVRTRGVMEKCTFCVQRISAARIEAKKEDRAIGPSEVVTACQQACPTRAIVFGNINDPESEVAKLKAEPLNYGVLADLNTQPRVTYLARLNNPNPEIEDEAS